MNEVILKIENLSKQYRLGTIGTGTISHDINRWWANIRGKDDPYLKVGETNDRATKATSQYVWALKDINFEVKRGEVLGIIGKNGAGKSTLLKILSKVTGPTTGSIKSRGRIASLLEVGTGFHPEMTGKENIFLNGAILGMTKKEITAKIDEIIDFSGCQRYIDTPVKRYSSGMTVRLAFAVAAFMEPDILIIDEVLAVGDAEFQKKAIGKMKDISNTDGRTVLFVSHDMAAIEKLCKRTILLVNGSVFYDGFTNDTIQKYRSTTLEGIVNSKPFFNLKEKYDVIFTSFILSGASGVEKSSFSIDENISFKLGFKSLIEAKVNLRVAIFDLNETRILAFDTSNTINVFAVEEKKSYLVNCNVESGLEIKPGEYFVNISMKKDGDLLDHKVKVVSFKIEKSDYYKSGKLPMGDIPLILKKNKWKIEAHK